MSVDITNETTVPYDFAQVSTTAGDIVQTKRILQKVHKHIAEFVDIEMRPSSVSFINKHRRSCRIIFYDLDQLLKQENLFVVIFYANKRPNLSAEANKNFFETDWKIAMAMMGDNNILCYASQELSDGNWFNIVLFTKESDKHTVTVQDRHHHAAYTLAPQRFDWIRLHNGFVPTGIMNYKGIFLTSTKYYYFDENWFATRTYPRPQAAQLATI